MRGEGESGDGVSGEGVRWEVGGCTPEEQALVDYWLDWESSQLKVWWVGLSTCMYIMHSKMWDILKQCSVCVCARTFMHMCMCA